ncbi:hypothetical protein NUU61_008816 [Penicillium alfredii]|uniref:Uncharacterized protein n=1 Tax=Penicillium alfredii TaxID=1506179 RepID=A0A9W9ELV7_9EURO|nr:uncharacterized protein NUU61_008816 [Penicillium alfredii]KAJ5084237.1 hypothetical protein NUU61_008816 [Penicillium alfredii]
MPRASSTIFPPALHGSSTSRSWPASSDLTESLPTVTIALVRTQTVHTTWIYSREVVTTLPETSSTSDPATVLSRRPLEDLLVSSTPGTSLLSLWHLDAHSSAHEDLPVPFAGSSTASLRSSLPTSSQSSRTMSTTTNVVQIATATNTPSYYQSTSPFVGIPSSTTGPSKDSPAHTQDQHSPNVGVIIGSVVGGVVFIAFALLACFLLFRRRRRASLQRQRQSSRQGLLRSGGSISSIQGYHHRQYSHPLFPLERSHSIPTPPAFSASRQFSNPFEDRYTVPPMPGSNPDLSLDALYLRGEPTRPWSHYTDDPFEDPENSSASPLIELSPPSRTLSTHSQSSWEGGLQLLEYYDTPSRGSHYDNYYFEDNALTLPSQNSQAQNRGFLFPSKYLDTPMMRDSARSDPFDLEPPPNAVHRRPPVPLPTPWGIKF